MKRSFSCIIWSLTLALAGASLQAQNVSFAPYRAPTGTELFSPGVLSNSFYQRDLAFAPDGGSLIYSHVISVGSRAVLVERKIVDGNWSLPQVLPFSAGPYDIEPFFSIDGNKLYFASNRTGSNGFDIWVVDKHSDGSWGTPENLGSPVNTSNNEFYPAVDEQGTLYWTAKRENGVGGEDIWQATPEGDSYTDVKPVPGDLNTTFDEFNAHVNAKGTRILFSSFGRPDGNGGGDLYSSSKSGGSWGAGSNRGTIVNSSSLDYCPAFSLDGKYFFFTSDKPVQNNASVSDAFDVAGIANLIMSPGRGNIYWKKF